MTGVRYPVDALISYHYFRTDQLMTSVLSPKLRLIGDSGAFSAKTQGAAIDVDTYGEWCKAWGPQLSWTASLDVIGDAAASLRNWERLVEHHGVQAVPTIHFGTDPAAMDPYAKQGVDFMGLGGIVGNAPRAMAWLVAVFRHARTHHPAMRFHGWGLTTRNMVDKLPFYSLDSSGIAGSAYRWGKASLWDPRATATVHISFDGRNPYKHGELLRRYYDVDPGAVERSTPANVHLIMHLMVASTQMQAAWLNRRFGVDPPSWGVREPVTGTRIHIAATSPGTFKLITDDLEAAV